MISPLPDINAKTIRRICSWSVFALALITYCLTLEPGASYWDCPEYIVTAFRLEPGHPPGNPVWSLTARMFSILGGSPSNAAVAVNLSSALFMAAGSGILCSVIFIIGRLSLFRNRRRRKDNLILGLISCAGALCFAWADSPWFSAVEAEVYAFSLFLTALCFRLMLAWNIMADRVKARRYLLLIGYLTGLSIGVHQLNLLIIPALALIWIYHRHHRPTPWRTLLALLISFLIIGAILFIIMPGVPAFASVCELFCVNSLRFPYHSGVILAWIILLSIAILLPSLTQRHISLSWQTILWMPAMLLIGFSAYFILLIRGYANPPMNEGAPSDIFALSSYLARDQYGSSPLLYGRTPYSKPLRMEVIDSAGNPSYTTYARRERGKRFTHSLRPDSPAYIQCGNRYEYIYQPELNMLFPRLTSSNPDDIASYGDWCGMHSSEMDSVEVSFALDSLGRPVGKLGTDGLRHKEKALRPTYLQQLRYLFGYQIGYMYLRYLMWNFSGRQNDRFSVGEIEHGNFITGITPVDTAMLGSQKLMPREIGADNRGRNVYFMVPLILGILGIIAMGDSRNRFTRRWNFIIFTLFFMTGIAIVLYLNQTPREPRERDYSFLGSFWAFTIWIACGLQWLWIIVGKIHRQRYLRVFMKTLVITLSIATPLWMLSQNYDDHDRSGRFAVEDYACNFLNSLDQDAIVFVNGDNYTFPIWYAQEVLGIRRDVTLVNTAYLSTPWYALQLTRHGECAQPLSLQVPLEDLSLGKFSYMYYESIPLIPGEGRAVDAMEALRSAYSAPHGSARLPALLRIPTVEGDSIVLSAIQIADGKGYISAANLITFDIVLSNAVSDSPRPVYWLDLLPRGTYSGFFPLTYSDLFTRRLSLSRSDTVPDQLPISNLDIRSGGADRMGFYADCTLGGMITRQRLALTSYATRLLRSGHPLQALEAARTSLRLFPASIWEYQIVNGVDSVHREGHNLAQLLIAAGNAVGDTTAVKEGERLLRREQKRYREWTRYRNSLSGRQRNLLSPKNMRKAREGADS